MRATSAVLTATPARSSDVVPRVLAAFVAAVSLTLLTVGAMSPYTHSNLVPGYDRSYTRTDQIVVGAPVPYDGLGRGTVTGDGIATGERLFVSQGCVTCHGLGGHGGVVGPAIEHNDAQTLRQRTSTGPRGMPRFSDALTDDEIAAISAYLRSVPAPKGGTP